MKTLLKKLYAVVLDIVELYIPAVTFTIMFSVFILQIIFRYALNMPLKWTYEVTVLAFIWTTLLGACYMRRIGKHINFNMLYNARSERTQLLFRLIGNGIVLFTCIICFYPTITYLDFIFIDKSPVLRLPMGVGFFPIIVFLLLIGVHSAEDLVRDIRITLRRGRDAS